MSFKTFINKFWKNVRRTKHSVHKLFGESNEQIKLENCDSESHPNLTDKKLHVVQIECEKEVTEKENLQGIIINKETKIQNTNKVSEKSTKSLVRSELNLEQNCVFTVSTYRGKSREVIRRETTPNGEIVERRVIVGRTANNVETGVLTTYHFKVYLALIELWEKAGKPTGDKVRFTTLKLMERLEMKDSGEEYKRLKRWVRDLRQNPITFVNSFYASGTLEHTDLADVTILNHLHLYERKNIGKLKKTRGYGEFRFDDHILENLINNHVHPLRLDVVKSFTKHKDLSILLYTYIDRNVAFKDSYEISLEKLFDHLDLSQRHVKYASDRKRVLDPILDEIRGKELSTGILSHADIQKTANGQDYKLVCRKKPFPKKLRDNPEQLMLPVETEPDEPEIPESPEPGSELFPLLIDKGLTTKQAAKLMLEKDPEDIKMQVEYLPYRVKEYKNQGKEINMPAILYDSIADNWNIPKGYIEAGKAREREAKRLEAERMALEEREEWDRAEQERERIKAYKESLSSEDRAKLREEALEQIRSMEGVKEGFITDMLIELKENEILREKTKKEP